MLRETGVPGQELAEEWLGVERKSRALAQLGPWKRHGGRVSRRLLSPGVDTPSHQAACLLRGEKPLKDAH